MYRSPHDILRRPLIQPSATFVSFPSWALLLFSWVLGKVNLGRLAHYSMSIETINNNLYSVSTFGLIDGGFAGLIWGYIAVFIGFIFIYASMSELASMQDLPLCE